MLSRDDPLPSFEEVRQQLARIVASTPFKSRKTAADVLEFLVQEAIKGKAPKEKDIRKALFDADSYDPLSTLVRTHIRHVRTFVRDYYRDEGCNDPVLISLPVRAKKKVPKTSHEEPYPVIFRYNRDRTYLKMGMRFLAEPSPYAVHRAIQLFDTILAHNPDHAAACAGRVECLCIMAIYAPDSRPRAAILDDALTTSKRLLKENPGYVNAQIANAAALLCNRHPFKAAVPFAAALKIDPVQPPQNLWFAAILFLTGNQERARQVSLNIFDERPDDFAALAAYGFYLYLTRDFSESEQVFISLTSLDKGSWLARLGLSFICLSTGKPEDAMALHRSAQRLLHHADPVVMPGVGMLAMYRANADDQMYKYLTDSWRKFLALPAEEKDWIQGALTIMEINQEYAVQSLVLALQFRHPLVMLLPFWPVFDPLREREDFQRLIAEITPSNDSMNPEV